MDQDFEVAESDDDFKTMRESEMDDNEQMMFGEGQVLAEAQQQKDFVCQLSCVHEDHVYCLSQLPHAPYNTFLSGDGNDKCFLWAIKPKKPEAENQKMEEEKDGEKTA